MAGVLRLARRSAGATPSRVRPYAMLRRGFAVVSLGFVVGQAGFALTRNFVAGKARFRRGFAVG